MSKTNNKGKYTGISPIRSMQDILIKAIQAERMAIDGEERYSADEERRLIEKISIICQDADQKQKE